MRNIAVWSLSLLALASVHAQVKALNGRAMPAWSMKTTDGKQVSSASTKGKVVLLDFWATWCGPCKAATPTMEGFHKAYSAKGLVVIGADGLEQKKGPQPARDYKAHGKYGFAYTYDNDALMKKLKIQGVPTFILIDRKGKVVFTANEWTDKVKTDLTSALKSVMGS